MEELHRQLNTEEVLANLAPSKVEGSIGLCSNSTSPTSTLLGGNITESENLALDKLADLLLDIYLTKKIR